MRISEFEDRLDCIVSSRTTRLLHEYAVSEEEKEEEEEELQYGIGLTCGQDELLPLMGYLKQPNIS